MDMSQIQKTTIGKFVENRTSIYLVPALIEYGKTFTTKISNLKILKFGIYDEDLEDLNVILGKKSIYILFDAAIRPTHTSSVIDWFSNQEYYVDCVPYRDYNYSLQLLIIDFPDSLEGAYDKFLLGKYNEMYTKQELEKYFDVDIHSKALGVLKKTRQAGQDHIKRVKTDYNTSLTSSDIIGTGIQYDYPPQKEEEFFNFKKK